MKKRHKQVTFPNLNNFTSNFIKSNINKLHLFTKILLHIFHIVFVSKINLVNFRVVYLRFQIQTTDLKILNIKMLTIQVKSV